MRIAVYQYDLGNPDSMKFFCRPGPMTRRRRATMYKTFETDMDCGYEEVFALLNSDQRPTAQTSYSLSVGDVVVIEGRAKMVDSVGLVDVPAEFFQDAEFSV